MRQPLGYKEGGAGKGQYRCEFMQALCAHLVRAQGTFPPDTIEATLRTRQHMGEGSKIFKAAPELQRYLKFIGNGRAEWLAALASGTVQYRLRCMTYAKACRWDPGQPRLGLAQEVLGWSPG
jgi:hypothetical protein